MLEVEPTSQHKYTEVAKTGGVTHQIATIRTKTCLCVNCANK